MEGTDCNILTRIQRPAVEVSVGDGVDVVVVLGADEDGARCDHRLLALCVQPLLIFLLLLLAVGLGQGVTVPRSPLLTCPPPSGLWWYLSLIHI